MAWVEGRQDAKCAHGMAIGVALALVPASSAAAHSSTQSAARRLRKGYVGSRSIGAAGPRSPASRTGSTWPATSSATSRRACLAPRTDRRLMVGHPWPLVRRHRHGRFSPMPTRSTTGKAARSIRMTTGGIGLYHLHASEPTLQTGSDSDTKAGRQLRRRRRVVLRSPDDDGRRAGLSQGRRVQTAAGGVRGWIVLAVRVWVETIFLEPFNAKDAEGREEINVSSLRSLRPLRCASTQRVADSFVGRDRLQERHQRRAAARRPARSGALRSASRVWLNHGPALVVLRQSSSSRRCRPGRRSSICFIACAGFRGDDLRPARVVAVLGGVADRVAHVVEPALIDQVDDQLQLVQALEVARSPADSRPRPASRSRP